MIDQGYIASFEEAGAAAGAAFRTYLAAFTQNSGGANTEMEVNVASHGFVIYYQSLMAMAFATEDPPPQENQDETQMVCGQCQCNICNLIDVCPVYPETEGVYPPPCEACRDRVGPLTPMDSPECGRYTPLCEDPAPEGDTQNEQ